MISNFRLIRRKAFSKTYFIRQEKSKVPKMAQKSLKFLQKKAKKGDFQNMLKNMLKVKN